MPHSDASPSQESPSDPAQETPGQALAVWAEALYLCNLLLLPGIAFAVLLHLYFKHRASAPALAVCHLRQTIAGSIWAGMLLGVVTVAVLLTSDISSEATWVIVIIYLTCFHTTLVMIGIIALSKAMAGQSYVYPLIGQPCA